jgi:hypothetical protein
MVGLALVAATFAAEEAEGEAEADSSRMSKSKFFHAS